MHNFIASLAILFLETRHTDWLLLEDTSQREKILDIVEQSSKKYNPTYLEWLFYLRLE